MNHKFDVATLFPTFLKQMKTQFNTRVKVIQSDGGGEFVNEILHTHFKTNGIIHRFFCQKHQNKTAWLNTIIGIS
jgi:hypothetical protein